MPVLCIFAEVHALSDCLVLYWIISLRLERVFQSAIPRFIISQWIQFILAMTIHTFIITVRPVQSTAMPVLFLLSRPKWVFRPAEATRCPDKHEIWHGELCSLVPNFTFIGAEMWEYSPQNCQNSNFGQKFVPERQLVCSIFTKFSAFVRVYR